MSLKIISLYLRIKFVHLFWGDTLRPAHYKHIIFYAYYHIMKSSGYDADSINNYKKNHL